MKLLALLFASWAAAAGQKSAPPPLSAPGPLAPPAAKAPLLPSLAVRAVPAAAVPAVRVVPASPALEPAAAVELERAAQAAAPPDGKGPEPQAQQAVFDGAAQPRAADPEFAFSAQPVPAQLAAAPWYKVSPRVVPWSAAGKGEGWVKFYRALYVALAAQAPPGYRHQTPRGPVFHLGGHDVVQAVLGVPRTYLAGEVNLYGRFANPEQLLELWAKVEVDGPRGRLEIDVNPESTQSLARMIAAGRVQNNIFLKWNLVSLTPDGVEIRALDARERLDLERRTLRLATDRGLLSGYEAHYNLIVAYRAMRETAPYWRLEPATRRFFARSLLEMPAAELELALSRAAESPAFRGERSNRRGMEELLAFIGRELGPMAAARARRVARELPAEEGGGLEDGIPSALLQRAAPFRTDQQLERVASLPSAERARFALIGDAEPGRFWWSRVVFNVPDVFRRLLRMADQESADFIVQLGDMVSRGTLGNYERFFGLLSAIQPRKPYLTVIGNHDRASPHGVSNARLYRALFGRQTDYFFDRAGVRFVALDSSAGRLTPEQLDWLDAALDVEGPKIVFTHIPPAYLREWTDVPGLKGVGGFSRGADRFREIVERRGVARVYVGHIHAFARLERGGVRYVLTGGGGSALFPSVVKRRFHHYLVVEVGAAGVTETVRLPNGASFPLEWDGR